jgi:ketosteroid isomerase-like protein
MASNNPLDRARKGAIAEARSLFQGAAAACKEDDVPTAIDLAARGDAALKRAESYNATKEAAE